MAPKARRDRPKRSKDVQKIRFAVKPLFMSAELHNRQLKTAITVLVLGFSGCEPSSPNPSTATRVPSTRSVVVYCSVDEGFSRSVLDDFSRRTGIELSVIYDSEAGKTTGLVNRIIQEARSGRPRADVFWSSELFNTILLARRGLLAPFDPPSAADIPQRFKDPMYRWTALASRARVLAYDPVRTSPELVPKTWQGIAAPKYANQVVIANPLFGTTRGHVAAMFALWGTDRATGFLRGLRDHGVSIADGNSSAVRAVIAGRASMAATDTDDVWVAQRGGASLDLVYPDLGDGGTLLIPCSVALVTGVHSESSEAARRLVDYLVSADVERMLAQSDSRNIPVRNALLAELNMTRPPETKIGFDAIANAMDEAASAVREILIR
jgi:iron(III) transport system substrate-binding protein